MRHWWQQPAQEGRERPSSGVGEHAALLVLLALAFPAVLIVIVVAFLYVFGGDAGAGL